MGLGSLSVRSLAEARQEAAELRSRTPGGGHRGDEAGGETEGHDTDV
jgi:hypothetical protein